MFNRKAVLLYAAMLTDYHTHTPLCNHAEGTPDEFVRAALRAGLAEYGIADHAPMPDEPFDEWRMEYSRFPEYFAWIEQARKAAPESLTIRAGLECDWVEGIEEWTKHLAGLYPWDYLIGSVHYLGEKWDFDNPLWIPRWEHVNVDEVWEDYWNTCARMAGSGLFDILGHVDLVKKFGYVPQGGLKHFYEPVIEAMADYGTALEINTAGWYKPCAEAYPSPEFLSLACKAGIPLLINSDAHAPGEIGRDFDKALKLAWSAGYRKLARFSRRICEEVPFDV